MFGMLRFGVTFVVRFRTRKCPFEALVLDRHFEKLTVGSLFGEVVNIPSETIAVGNPPQETLYLEVPVTLRYRGEIFLLEAPGLEESVRAG